MHLFVNYEEKKNTLYWPEYDIFLGFVSSLLHSIFKYCLEYDICHMMFEEYDISYDISLAFNMPIVLLKTTFNAETGMQNDLGTFQIKM